MSLDSWKKEYYPVPAEEVDLSNAIEHPLRKWRGLRPDALEEHNVTVINGLLFDAEDFAESRRNLRPYLAIDAESCALCIHYYDEEAEVLRVTGILSPDVCINCPLFSVLGKRCDDGADSPYMLFLNTHNPGPMIRALEMTLEAQKEKGEISGA